MIKGINLKDEEQLKKCWAITLAYKGEKRLVHDVGSPLRVNNSGQLADVGISIENSNINAPTMIPLFETLDEATTAVEKLRPLLIRHGVSAITAEPASGLFILGWYMSPEPQLNPMLYFREQVVKRPDFKVYSREEVVESEVLRLEESIKVMQARIAKMKGFIS